MEISRNKRSQTKILFNFRIYEYNMHGESVSSVKKRMFNFLNESGDFLAILVCACDNSREQDQFMEVFLRSYAPMTEEEMTTWLFDEFFNIKDCEIRLQLNPPKFAYYSVKAESTTCREACKADSRPLFARLPQHYFS
jgi:hypothetical protein